MGATTYKKRVDADELRSQMRGYWLDCFQALVPGFFDDAIAHLGTHVTCPFHGGENDFRFIKRSTRKGRGNTADEGVAMCTCGSYPDGFATLRRATGWSFPETLEKVDEWRNGRSYQAAPVKPLIKAPTKEEDEKRDEEVRAKVVNLWGAGKSLDLKAVPYFKERGLDERILAEMTDVRFMASLGYYELVENESTKEKELTKTGSYPAILALMRDSKGNPVAVHRTWLSKDKTDKAPVVKAKKLSQTAGAAGAAIRLYNAIGSDVLGLAEGTETAHAARQLSAGRYWPELGKVPVWATYSERNIRNFVIPEELLATLKKIVIFADNDESGTGLAAATEFKERMAVEHPEIEVVIKMPDVVGNDWNDVLVNL